MSRALALLACVAASTCASAQSMDEALFNRLLEMQAIEEGESYAHRNERLLAAFLAARSEAGAGAETGRKSTDSLRWNLRSAHLLVFFSQDARAFSQLGATYSELKARDDASQEDHLKYIQALVAMRRLTQARQLAEDLGLVLAGYDAIPAIVGSSRDDPATTAGPRLFEAVSPSEVRLIDAGDIGDIALLIIAHPACEFSRRALTSLSTRADIISATSMRIIAPVETRVPTEAVHDWNEDHPSLPIRVAFRNADWPMVQRWSTPQFYFLSKGHVVDHVEGWPSDEQLSVITRKLAVHAAVHAKEQNRQHTE